MYFSKSIILPVLGLLALAFFIAMSYYNNQILLDKVLQCSFILAMLFIFKIQGHAGRSHINTNKSEFQNSKNN